MLLNLEIPTYVSDCPCTRTKISKLIIIIFATAKKSRLNSAYCSLSLIFSCHNFSRINSSSFSCCEVNSIKFRPSARAVQFKKKPSPCKKFGRKDQGWRNPGLRLLTDRHQLHIFQLKDLYSIDICHSVGKRIFGPSCARCS